MSQATVFEKNGSKKGKVELNDAVFGVRVNQRLLDLIQTAYAGNLRRGTHETKTRKEVRGGGRKPWRQKGTGRARHGSRRSPIWRGGGVVFGPHTRSYRTHISTTMKPKTKELAGRIKALTLDGARALLVVDSVDEKLKRASGNLKKFSVRLAKEVNAYHILHRRKLIIEKAALPILESRVLVKEEAEPVKEGKNS
jgi:large subunit ribosomal protein L4